MITDLKQLTCTTCFLTGRQGLGYRSRKGCRCIFCHKCGERPTTGFDNVSWNDMLLMQNYIILLERIPQSEKTHPPHCNPRNHFGVPGLCLWSSLSSPSVLQSVPVRSLLRSPSDATKSTRGNRVGVHDLGASRPFGSFQTQRRWARRIQHN